MDLAALAYNIISSPPKELFRAYDIRGKVSKSHLTDDFYYSLGLVLGRDNETFIVARDGRISSPGFSKALIKGLLTKSNVINIGIVPSPVMYFATHHLKIKNGLVITGSHNPADENGIKMILNNVALKENAITDIQKAMSRLERKHILETKKVQLTCVEQAYIDAIKHSIRGPLKLKVVVDCGNGATGMIAPKVFKALGADVIEVFTKIDGSFPNRPPDPSSSKNLKELVSKVIEHKAHLGVAFDGDGDRLGAVTNKGRVIPADLIMALFSEALLKDKPQSKIIFDIKCSQQLQKTIEENQGTAIPWKTGHSHIKSKMKEENAALAGEMSGHVFFKDRWYGFDDGVYSACRLCELVQESDLTLDELYEPYCHTFLSEEIKIHVDNALKFDIIKSIVDSHRPIENTKTTLIDGLRIDFKHGWGIVRASNTSSCLTLRAEGNSHEDLNQILDYFTKLADHHIELISSN